jgi:hypothetical protein
VAHPLIRLGGPAEARDAGRLLVAYQELASVTRAASPWPVIHGDTAPADARDS